MWAVGVIVAVAEVGPSGEREAFEGAYQNNWSHKNARHIHTPSGVMA
jgi:hypothetical protein